MKNSKKKCGPRRLKELKTHIFGMSYKLKQTSSWLNFTERNWRDDKQDAFGDREKLCEFEEYLVKGNIYENPELLEVSEWKMNPTSEQ